MGIELSRLGEFQLIDRLTKAIKTGRCVVQGIGDDTAVLKVHSLRYLLFTTDMIVEGVHFTKRSGFAAVGRKALACSISDIAAMGGRPTFAVISLGVPPGCRFQDVRAVYQGLKRLAREFKVDIIGGDTVRCDKIVISVALLGEVKRKDFVTRGGAKPGDQIFVTGPLGRSGPSGKHCSFTPRVNEARYLVRYAQPTAMIDISDGLAADLGHICRQSRVGARLIEEKIPKAHRATLKQALYDGEDYELIFCLPARKAGKFKEGKAPFRFYHIGEITGRAEGLTLIHKSQKNVRLSAKGYTHF